MSSLDIAGVVQQLAAALQPLISLELWAQITSAALRPVQDNPASMMQSLFRVSRDAIPQLEAFQQQQLCLTSLAAISGLTKLELPGPALTIMIYRDICVPLLAADAKLLVARHNQIIQAFSRIVAAGSMWSSAFLLLDEAANTLQSGLHPTESHALGVGGLTHPQQCLLVKCLLLAGLHQASEAGAADHQELCRFLERAMQLLRPVVCAAVRSPPSGCATHVVQDILPVLCKLAEELGPTCRAEFVDMLWASCRQALQDRSHGQAAALRAVVQNVTFLMPLGEDNLQASDMRADPTFWAVLRQQMVDDNAYTRKQGLFVVEHAVACLPVSAQPAWQALLRLLALLEDFALHLIKAEVTASAGPLPAPSIIPLPPMLAPQ
ncbi:hypothetical protein ABBQ38_013461 [Trebouxia sp. C0009 RCD-2024]